jgi:hypothetical protein
MIHPFERDKKPPNLRTKPFACTYVTTPFPPLREKRMTACFLKIKEMATPTQQGDSPFVNPGRLPQSPQPRHYRCE